MINQNKLLESKLNDFKKSGFVVLKKIFDKKKINSYRKEIDKISIILLKNYKAPYVNTTIDKKLNTGHHLNEIFPKSIFMKIEKNKVLKIFIKNIFKKKMELKNIEIFAKPPKTGMKAPFHQDNYYWNIKNKMAVNIWIALDKTTIQNGGLIYYDGSHKLGLLKHFNSNVPGSSKEVDKKLLKHIKLKKISPILNPGDCLIHHCEIIHGSKRNKTNYKRRGIALRFVAKNAQVDKLKMKKYLTDLKNI